MSITARALLAYLVIALIVFAWMFRYDVKATGSDNAFVVDRWTGKMHLCLGSHCDFELDFRSPN
jgi:hypothetical protein